MNPILENILTRRNCRAFSDKPIPREILADILKAASYAPSGMNRQTWEFIAVTNQESSRRG